MPKKARDVVQQRVHKQPPPPARQVQQAQQAQPKSPAPKASASLPKASPATRTQDFSKDIASVRQATQTLLAQEGIPSEEKVVEALRLCNATARLVADPRANPAVSGTQTESSTAASNLLSLDANGSGLTQSTRARVSVPSRVREMIDDISDAAYQIIAHPPVTITPQVLELYVDVQAQLGEPETLPYAFSLYANKPKPKPQRGHPGSIQYVKQNPNKAANAVDSLVVEQALDTAVEAKHLDAAIGIIEASYATQAFMRAKLLKKSMLPVAAMVGTPFAAYMLSSKLAGLQNSFDHKTATYMATTGFITYVFFTSIMGFIALTTQNDHMKRVTWSPGEPLRDRYLREEERAAFDKVACAFGFQEAHRFGEEQGADFQKLREFLLWRGMILDRVELMEGMS